MDSPQWPIPLQLTSYRLQATSNRLLLPHFGYARILLLCGTGVNLILPAGEALVAGDETRAAGEGEVGPDPLRKH